ncbi:MAG: transcription antitermination factor NusB [Comamonas sp.]
MSDEQSSHSASSRPPRQTRTGTTSTGARKAGSKSNRSRAREFALQGLYQHIVGHNAVLDIDRFTRDLAGFHKADSAHYDALLRGCVEAEQELDTLIAPKLDRTISEISPIEHACMWIGVYEFQHCPDVPWRVVLNECIELAKEFGGTDGHNYVNAVLNGLAPQLRSKEVEHDRAGKPSRAAAEESQTAQDDQADQAPQA